MDDLLQLFRRNGEVTVSLRIRPNAPRTKFLRSLSDGSLKIDVAAPAEDGKANEELIRFLAKSFGVPRGNVALLRGQTGRVKVVSVRRVSC